MGDRDFEDLEMYQAARELRRAAYALAWKLPDVEKYGLAQQMRRAAVSVTNNIAEGHGTYTFQQNISYLHQVRGSVSELRDDLNVCRDEGYAPGRDLSRLNDMAVRVTQLIDGCIRYLRGRQTQRDRT